MKLLATVCTIALFSFACGSNETTTTTEEEKPAEEKSEWTVLFNGSNTDSWHKYGGGPAGPAWKIIDSTLVLDTTGKANGKIVGGGNLLTNDEFDNFHLKLEWKISKNGNSGILFYVVEDTAKYPEPYYTGLEMQVLDNDGHPDGKIIKHRAGDLYDLISCSKETVNPVGEWNLAEIVSNNGKLELWLNGTNVVSTTLWDDNWKQMVANSKFKQWADFSTAKKGHICLQDHDNMVSYRNIVIKKL